MLTHPRPHARALQAAHCYSALTAAISDADLDFIHGELQAGDAMYYLHDGFVHRYVVRLGVRVVSPPPPGLSQVLPGGGGGGGGAKGEGDNGAEAWAADDVEGADEDGFVLFVPPPPTAPALDADAGEAEEGSGDPAPPGPEDGVGGPHVFLRESSRRCISLYGNAHDGDDGAHVDGDSAPPPESVAGPGGPGGAADSRQARRQALLERGEGSVLEMCCAYHVYEEKQVVEPPPDDGRGRFTRGKKAERKVEEVLITRYQHKGSKVSAGGLFRPSDPFEDLPLVGLLPEAHAVKPNMFKVRLYHVPLLPPSPCPIPV